MELQISVAFLREIRHLIISPFVTDSSISRVTCSLLCSFTMEGILYLLIDFKLLKEIDHALNYSASQAYHLNTSRALTTLIKQGAMTIIRSIFLIDLYSKACSCEGPILIHNSFGQIKILMGSFKVCSTWHKWCFWLIDMSRKQDI